MLISDLPAVLNDLVNSGHTTVVESEPGRGKSTLMRKLVRDWTIRDGFTWGYQTLFMATQSPTEMLGYQFKGERWWDEDGNLVKPGTKNVEATAVTEPTLPPWMLSDEGKPVWAYRRGLLVVEEWGQGENDAKRAAAQLLLMGELGTHRLPGFNTGDGWGIVALTNGASHRSGVTKEMDFIINRVCWLKLTDDVEGTLAHMVQIGILPVLVAFTKRHPEIVFRPGVPEKQGPWTTPRSVEATSDFLKERLNPDGTVPVDPITQETVTGYMGYEDTRALFEFIRLEQETLPIDAILADPHGVPVPPSLDAKYLACFQLAYAVSEKNASKVLVYIDRLGKEFAVTFAKAACDRFPRLIATPAFDAWTDKNSSVMALMQRFSK